MLGGKGLRTNVTGKATLRQTLGGTARMNCASTGRGRTKKQVMSDTFQEGQDSHMTECCDLQGNSRWSN